METSKKELEDIIDQKVEKRLRQRKQGTGRQPEGQIETPDNESDSSLSRRGFLKAAGAGVAGLGAAAMIGNASAFRINSNQGLSYFNQSSNQSQFNVSPDGILDVNQIGTNKNPIGSVHSKTTNTDEISTYSNGPDVFIHTDGNGDYVATSKEQVVARNSTDVAPVFEAAVNADLTAGNHSDVIQNSIEFGGGKFIWRTSITVGKAFDLWGQGRNRTIIDNRVSDGTALTITDAATAITEMYFLKWASNAATKPNGHIYFKAAHEITIGFCEFRDTSYGGVKLQGPGQLLNLHNCWFTNSDVGNVGLAILNPTEGWIEACNFNVPVQVRKPRNIRFVNNQFKGRGQLSLRSVQEGPAIVANNTFHRDNDRESLPLIYLHSQASSITDADIRIHDNQFYDETSNAETGIVVGDYLSQINIYGNTFDGSLGTPISIGPNALPKTWDNDGADDFQSIIPYPSPSAGDWYLDDGTNSSSGTRGKRVYDGSAWQDAWTL